MCQCARPTESQTNLELTATLPVKGTSVGVVGAPWSKFRIPVRRAERETETEIRSLSMIMYKPCSHHTYLELQQRIPHVTISRVAKKKKEKKKKKTIWRLTLDEHTDPITHLTPSALLFSPLSLSH